MGLSLFVRAAAIAAIASSACSHPPASEHPPITADHVPIAVHSLDDAARTFERLGFRLKAGRPHANGLRNAFVKFADGTYLELISPEAGATDELSARYVAFLDRGEGGAFLAARTDSLERLAGLLRAGGLDVSLQHYGTAFTTLGFGEDDLSWFFLIEYGTPVVDPPELLDHPNTALGLETVWLAPDAHAELASNPRLSGTRRVAAASGAADAAPVAGVTLHVRSVEEAWRVIREGTGLDLPVIHDARGARVVVPADRARGVWIELLEPGAAG